MREYMRMKEHIIKKNWESLSEEKQLELMNKKAKEILNANPKSIMKQLKTNKQEYYDKTAKNKPNLS